MNLVIHFLTLAVMQLSSGFFVYAQESTGKEDENKMIDLIGAKILFPLDEVLGIDRLPFKISIEAMLEIAYWVQLIPSYQASSKIIQRNTMVEIKEDTIRAVANHVGSLVFEADKAKAEKTWAELMSGKIKFPKKKVDHVLYLEVDGVMVHTRRKANNQASDDASEKADGENDAKKSNWVENKLDRSARTS
jgi:hypothetical protein